VSLFDWFFPEQAQAIQLRRIAEQHQSVDRSRSRESAGADYRLSRLEEHLGFVALVVGSLMEKLERSGVVSRRELREAIAELDELDGIRDGRLDLAYLQELSSQLEIESALSLTKSSDRSIDDEIAQLKTRLAQLEKQKHDQML